MCCRTCQGSPLDSLSAQRPGALLQTQASRMQAQVDQLSQKLRKVNNKVWSALRRLKTAETAAGAAKQKASELDEALGKERGRTKKLKRRRRS